MNERPIPPKPKLSFHALDYAACVGILAYAMSATVTPICLVIVARELGFSLLAGGAIEVVRSATILTALIGSGFVAGRFGKTVSLGASGVALGAGMLLYSVAPFYGAILLAVALLGFGGGIVEGLLNPLVQDLHRSDSGRYLNIVNGFWSVGFLLTMLLGGELLTRDVSWRLIVAGLGGFSIFSGVLFLTLRNRAPATPRFAAAAVLNHKREMVRMPAFWLFMGMMFAAGAVEGALTFWTASFIQLHHETLPRAAGVGAAFFAAGTVAGRFASGIWIHQHRLQPLMFVSAVTGIAVTIAVPAAPNLPLLFGALFAAGLTVACFWPSIQSYAADRLPVETTSLFILLSCGGIAGFAFASWTIGLIGDRANLQTGLLAVPGFFVLLAILLIVERKRG